MNIFSFYHSKTIDLQCKNLTSIHVTRRGQSPNDRMMILSLRFVSKSNNRHKNGHVCSQRHSGVSQHWIEKAYNNYVWYINNNNNI